jgi:hypothetical protein
MRKGWTAYRVEYDNGEHRNINNELGAISLAGRLARTNSSVKVTVNGKLLIHWEHSRIVYCYPYIPHSLI